MGLLCVHPLWDEAKMLPNPEDMCVDRKGLPSHAKKKETMNCLWTNAFEISNRFFDLFGTHLSQRNETQTPILFFDPVKDLTDPSRFLIG